MAYPILGTAKPAFFDSSGDPLAAGTITTLNPSNDAVKASYPTADDANASTNGTSGDITLDSRGEPTSTQYWGKDNEDYKVVIKDSAGTTVYTIDDIRMPAANRRAAVSFASSDATPTIAEGNTFLGNASTAQNITNFDDGEVGDTILVKAKTVEILLSDSASLSLANTANFRLGGDDVIMLHMFEDGVWSEVSRTFTGKTNSYVNSDVSLTDTTLADVTGLSSMKLRAATYYAVTAYLKVISDADSQDIKVALQTDQAFQEAFWTYTNANSAGTTLHDSDTATSAMTIDIIGTAGPVHGIVITGSLLTHATTAPTVDFQAAQGTPGGTTTLERGSWIKYEPITSK